MRGLQRWRAVGAGLMLGCALIAQGQVFQWIARNPEVASPASVPGPRPVEGSKVKVDVEGLRALLGGAPEQRFDVGLKSYGLRLELPAPDGGMVVCFAARSPVMEDGLAAKFPQMQTYLVQSEDGAATGRIEVTQRGLTGMLRTPYGTWMIDLWQSADPEHVIVYWLADIPEGGHWNCQTGGSAPMTENAESGYEPRVLRSLKRLKLAVACTGEFGVYHSTLQGHAPNVADPLAAIVTMVSRANVVFEGDVAVHFNLVANNDLIVFSDAATDPYETTCDGSDGAECSQPLAVTNELVLNERIEAANFDVGHVVTRVSGGYTWIGARCTSGKARAASGYPLGGDVDPLTALVLLHTLGHQLGASHTYAGIRGNCADASSPHYWEPGSGSSLMGRPGECPVGDASPSDNITRFADPYFHHRTVLYMLQSVSSPPTCGVQPLTTNHFPVVVSATASCTIPRGTPFVLSAQATDANEDVLTYSWEQYDGGVRRALGSADNGAGALFRIFPPVLSGERTFPRMEDVLSGVPTPGEQLPTFVTGTARHFTVIVRDNHPGCGATAQSELQVTFTGEPFKVTSPAEGTRLNEGLATVNWAVASTNVAPISVSTISIRLSTDGGQTFPQLLGSFPNNGQAVVNLPPVQGPARLRLDADGSIFFAVSRPFLVLPPCSVDYNNDGDSGTDADIEAFFACLAGNCCATCPQTADFNVDGDIGTDADIEAFFRVLAGGAC